jgi:hypothetical protein
MVEGSILREPTDTDMLRIPRRAIEPVTVKGGWSTQTGTNNMRRP